MGKIARLDSVRSRRTTSRFCLECRTYWSLIAVPDGESLVIMCKSCGHVRAVIPRPARMVPPQRRPPAARPGHPQHRSPQPKDTGARPSDGA